MIREIEIVDLILEAYLLALGGVDQSPDNAQPELKNRLLANVEKAKRSFSAAAANGLAGDCSHVVPATRKLFAANCASRQSLRDAEPIARLAYELERSSCLAADIVAQRIQRPKQQEADEARAAST